MGLIRPVRIKLDVRDLGDGRAELEYTEWYPEGVDVKLTVEVAVELLKKWAFAGCSLHPNEDNSITMRATASRDIIYSMLAGEFLLNSPLGKVTLSDLLLVSFFPPPPFSPPRRSEE
jgi:hypothetical protein